MVPHLIKTYVSTVSWIKNVFYLRNNVVILLDHPLVMYGKIEHPGYHATLMYYKQANGAVMGQRQK